SGPSSRSPPRSRRTPDPIAGPGVARYRTRSARLLYPVAHAGLGNDDLRSRGIGFDFSPQVRDVDAKILLRTSEFTVPHRVEDLLMGQRAAGRAEQRRENLPLDRRQVDREVVARNPAVDRVDDERPDDDRSRIRPRGERLRAPDLRLGARRQL